VVKVIQKKMKHIYSRWIRLQKWEKISLIMLNCQMWMFGVIIALKIPKKRK